jgi:hypothetical protein
MYTRLAAHCLICANLLLHIKFCTKHNLTAYRYCCELERCVCQRGVSRFNLHLDLHAVDGYHNVAITLTHICAGFMMHDLT